MTPSDIVIMGVMASLCASLGTAVGSLGVLAVRSLSRRAEDALLSLAAGIMLAATFFSLLLPALTHAESGYGSASLSALIAGGGVLLGALGLFVIHQCAPHEHFISGPDGKTDARLSQIWLFVIAITLHNFPEGLAVGVGFAGGEVNNGITLALGIGLQNVPEGLAVAVALRSVGYRPLNSALIGIGSGLVEPVGGLIGALAVSSASAFMPWALAMAAGAMLFIISDEIIPETHQGGNQNLATIICCWALC
ncbi:ZIP family metal transporter [Alteromonas sp. CYL-A6]|uniref:ZIP family metal transporter n=1 Tax=Alteromonas nitratireducens TaxID=3390813 RepID=UPI0034BCF4EB